MTKKTRVILVSKKIFAWGKMFVNPDSSMTASLSGKITPCLWLINNNSLISKIITLKYEIYIFIITLSGWIQNWSWAHRAGCQTGSSSLSVWGGAATCRSPHKHRQTSERWNNISIKFQVYLYGSWCFRAHFFRRKIIAFYVICKWKRLALYFG